MSKYPRQYTKKQLEDGRGIACKKGLGNHYSPVRVMVTNSRKIAGGGTVDLNTIEVDGNTHEYKDVPWGDTKYMWVFCPSTLSDLVVDPKDEHDPGEPGDVPEAGTVGVLYLSEHLLNTHLRSDQYDPPKFPDKLAGEVKYKDVVVWPISLVLNYVQFTSYIPMDLGTRESINLMDPRLADPEWPIKAEYGALKLRVSDEAIPILTADNILDELTAALQVASGHQGADPDKHAAARKIIEVCSSLLGKKSVASLSEREFEAIVALRRANIALTASTSE